MTFIHFATKQDNYTIEKWLMFLHYDLHLQIRSLQAYTRCFLFCNQSFDQFLDWIVHPEKTTSEAQESKNQII